MSCSWRFISVFRVMIKRKAVVNLQECVACGCCIKVCPRNAISIPNGVNALINRDLCVGLIMTYLLFLFIQYTDVYFFVP